MDRRLLLVPISALVAQAQSSPDAVEAQKALRQRVEDFYKLQQQGKFRQSEAYVAESSRDDYYNARKQEVRDFIVEKLELSANNTRAKVTIKAKMVMLAGAAVEIMMATESYWMIEDGQWCWYLDPATKGMMPFGQMMTGKTDTNGTPEIKGEMTGKAPDLNDILKKIAIDRSSFAFGSEERVFTATITNGTPGPLNLTLDPHAAMIRGLEASIDKTHLDAGESAKVLLKWTGTEPFSDEIPIRVDPYLRYFTLRVSAK